MKQRFFLCLLLFFAALIAVSCGTAGRVSQDRYFYIHDTTYVDRIKIDSLVVRDSVYVKEKADTVLQFRDRYEYRYVYLRDTAFVAVHDTSIVEVTKEVPVEKELTWGQRVKQRSFWWLVLAVAGLLGWIFREPLGKAIKILLKLI